ncbi:MAG: hypothetical protein RI940_750, partial [Bacteroidota bacterium]
MKRVIASLFFYSCIVMSANAQAKYKNFRDSIDAEAAKLEVWTNVPEVKAGNFINEAPSDAIILYNGKDFSAFHGRDGKKIGWKIDPDGALTDVKGAGDLITNQSFGDCQLHVEFRTPATVKGAGQSRG